MTDLTFRILKLFDDKDIREELYWNIRGENVEFFIICNDFFWWACADGETITEENFELLGQSINDTRRLGEGELYDEALGLLLFCARSRKMRPQGAYYKYIPTEAWPLFDAAGPDRKDDPEDTTRRPYIRNNVKDCYLTQAEGDKLISMLGIGAAYAEDFWASWSGSVDMQAKAVAEWKDFIDVIVKRRMGG